MTNNKSWIIIILSICILLSLIVVTLLANCAEAEIGDVDHNGVVDMADAQRILEYDVGTRRRIDKRTADVNGDGSIDSADAMRVMQMWVEGN